MAESVKRSAPFLAVVFLMQSLSYAPNDQLCESAARVSISFIRAHCRSEARRRSVTASTGSEKLKRRFEVRKRHS